MIKQLICAGLVLTAPVSVNLVASAADKALECSFSGAQLEVALQQVPEVKREDVKAMLKGKSCEEAVKTIDGILSSRIEEAKNSWGVEQ